MSLHRDGWLVLANIGTLGLLAWLNWGMWANVVVFLAAFEGWCLAVQVQRSRVGDEQGERSERD